MDYNIEIQDDKGNKYYPKTKTTDVFDDSVKNIQQIVNQIHTNSDSSGEVVSNISKNVGTSNDTASESSNTLWGRIKYLTNLFSNIWTSARAAKLDKLDANVSTRATQASVDSINTSVGDIKTKVTTINTNISKVDLGQLLTKINELSTKVEEFKTTIGTPKMPKLKVEFLQPDEGEAYTRKKFSIKGKGRLISIKGSKLSDSLLGTGASSFKVVADNYAYENPSGSTSGTYLSFYGLYNYQGAYMLASKVDSSSSAPSAGLPLNIPFNESLEINFTISENEFVKIIYEIYE